MPQSLAFASLSRRKVAVAGLLLLASWVYPPWQRPEGNSLGFCLLVGPGQPSGRAEVDVDRLALIDLIILGACGLWALVTSPRKQAIATPTPVVEARPQEHVEVSRAQRLLGGRGALVLVLVLPGLWSICRAVGYYRFSIELMWSLLALSLVTVALPAMLLCYGLSASGRPWLKSIAMGFGGLMVLASWGAWLGLLK